MRTRLLSLSFVLIAVLAITLRGDEVLKKRQLPLRDQAAAGGESGHAADGVKSSFSATAGRRAFVDPKTGNIVPRGPGAAPAPAVPAAAPLSTSGEGLREVPGRTRGGGVKLHLEGRFSSTVTARIGPDGNLTTRCRTETDGN